MREPNMITSQVSLTGQGTNECVPQVTWSIARIHVVSCSDSVIISVPDRVLICDRQEQSEVHIILSMMNVSQAEAWLREMVSFCV